VLPAHAAGLAAGDVLTSLADREIHAIEDVYAALRTHRPGDTVSATVQRDGRSRTLRLRLGERP